MNQTLQTIAKSLTAHFGHESCKWVPGETKKSHGKMETVLKKAYHWNYAESPNHANQKRLRGNRERFRPRVSNRFETHAHTHTYLQELDRHFDTQRVEQADSFRRGQNESIRNRVSSECECVCQSFCNVHGLLVRPQDFLLSEYEWFMVCSVFLCSVLCVHNALHQHFSLIVYLHLSIAWLLILLERLLFACISLVRHYGTLVIV